MLAKRVVHSVHTIQRHGGKQTAPAVQFDALVSTRNKETAEVAYNGAANVCFLLIAANVQVLLMVILFAAVSRNRRRNCARCAILSRLAFRCTQCTCNDNSRN